MTPSLLARLSVCLGRKPADEEGKEDGEDTDGEDKGERGPRFAIYNQVHFHLEVVAGAVHVLQQLTTEPVTVYLPAKVRFWRLAAGGWRLAAGGWQLAVGARFRSRSWQQHVDLAADAGRLHT